MSNRIGFFQPAQQQLSIPAAGASILLEGCLCNYLELIEVVDGGWGEFSWAKLRYNPAGCEQAETIPPEEVEDKVPVGKAVRIMQVYNGCQPDSGGYNFPIFSGQIESIKTKISVDGEKIEVIARDISAVMERIRVYGRRAARSDASSLFLAGEKTIFNKDSMPNAAVELQEHEGNTLTLFRGDMAETKLWSYAEAINYLLCEYLPRGHLYIPSIEQLESLTGGRCVYNLDVTGLNLLEALYRCCEQIGLRFKFVPRLGCESSEQAIVFYQPGKGRKVELNYQQQEDKLDIAKTTIAKFESRKNFWPITRKYVGQGEFKVYEATFDLIKAWDSSLEDPNDYDKFSPSTNSDFYQVKDVYRKWCLNEAGDYSGAPYNQGPAFDFSEIFGNSNFIHKHRRFRPTLTSDQQGKSLGLFLEVSYDDGLHWWQYLYPFTNLSNECGIWLSCNQFDVNTWLAIVDEELKFRMTASVVSDERLSQSVADGPVDSVTPVVEQLIKNPARFKYRKISSKSKFASIYDDSLTNAGEIDDSDALLESLRREVQIGCEQIESFDVQTPCLAFGFRTGDIVTSSPESRDLFSYRKDNRSLSWIERIKMDFQNQCTNLKIVRHRTERNG